MRTRARAVVIGGGVGGCSILYWLARLGWDDVVLVERADLTSGSTFHSAGLVGQLRSSLSLTRMMMASVDLYRTIGDEVGLETGWREVGSLRLASSPERLEEIARQAGWAKTFGLPLELISAAEAQELFPPMTTEGVLGAAYLPTDGYVDPSQLTFALAEGARRRGAEIATNTRVTAIPVERGRVTGVVTDKGEIEADVVVNAGGMFAAELGRLAGVTVPIVPMAHEYLVTRPAGLPLDMPTMRDPSLLVYFRPESGGLVMGGYEREPAPWSLDGIPPDFNGKLLEEDWPRFEPLLENAIRRVPALEEMEVVRLINGPEAFTPDGEFILGPTDVRGFWLAAGFCAHGLAGAGGMGKLVAEWIVEGTPSLDVWHMDSRRFGAAYTTRSYTLARTDRGLFDLLRRQVPRPRARGGASAAALACLPAAAGARRGLRREVRLGAGELVRAERCARRRGPAPARMGRAPLVAGDRRRAPGMPRGRRALRRVVVRQDRGRRAGCGRPARVALRQPRRTRCRRDHLHADAEREGRDRVRLHRDAARARTASGSSPAPRSAATISPGSASTPPTTARSWSTTSPRSTPASGSGARPPARSSLPLTTDPLDFPYLRARELAVGPVPCLALRVTYVGELGWELYCPSEFGLRLWDTIWDAGRGHGLVAGGYKAIDSLRLEKGYRVWGSDITADDTPDEAGLGFAVRRDKDFLGKEALLARPEPERRLACLTLADPRAVALGSEPVRVAGELVGRVTSGGFGYTVGRSIAYAYLPAASSEPGTSVEVEIFGEWVAGEVAAEPLYDPGGERLRV